MIEHLKADKGTFKSSSEVIQRAIEFFHDKTYPAYVYNQTPAGKIKELKLKELEAEANQTPEELVMEIKGRIVLDSTGNKFVRLRGMANVDRLLKYEDAKDILKIQTWLLSEHKNFITNGVRGSGCA